MPRPILATIHPAALRHNLEQARRQAQQSRVAQQPYVYQGE